MKRFLLLLLLLPSLAWGSDLGQEYARMNPYILGAGGSAAACADSSCTGFLICQNFETATTGYDNSESWTEAGTVEAAYTTGPLRGSQSCQMGESGVNYGRILKSIGTQTELYVFFRIAITDTTPADYAEMVNFLDGAADAAKIRIETTGQVSCNHGTVSDTNATPFAAGTNYIWIHYKGNTGTSDGILSMHRGSSRIYSEAIEICSITNGNDASTKATTLGIGDTGGYMIPIFDQVLVKTTAIGDVCE